MEDRGKKQVAGAQSWETWYGTKLLIVRSIRYIWRQLGSYSYSRHASNQIPRQAELVNSLIHSLVSFVVLSSHIPPGHLLTCIPLRFSRPSGLPPPSLYTPYQ